MNSTLLKNIETGRNISGNEYREYLIEELGSNSVKDFDADEDKDKGDAGAVNNWLHSEDPSLFTCFRVNLCIEAVYIEERKLPLKKWDFFGHGKPDVL